MKTTRVKAEAIAWLRFGKRLPIVCTEVGNWYSDVLGVGRTSSVEVETKISKSDLKAEFRNKTTKHLIYQKADEGLGRTVPNYMYFMVPEELKEAALEIVGTGNPKAGVAIVMEDSVAGSNIIVVKPAVKLHSGKPSMQMTRAAIMRMSSELVGLHQINERLSSNIYEEIKRMAKMATLMSFRSAGHLDTEDPRGSMDLRAAELALAVEGAAWDSMAEDQKVRWREIAKKYLDIAEPAVGDWNYATQSL